MCELHKKGFTKILSDNDEVYMQHLIAVIESVDEYSSLQITNTFNKIHFRLAPSLPKYNELLLQEILKLHNIFQIRLNLSKSIKTSGTINFDISLD
jgi:hypothetical protein